MKKVLLGLLFCSVMLPPIADARGGFSSGGRGSFSSGRSFSSPSRSFSSPSRSYSAPSRSYSAPRKSYSAPSYTQRSYSRPTPSYVQPRTTYNSTTNHYGNGGAGGGAGFGTGMLAGAAGMIVLDHLMHPRGTVPYAGGGYSGQAVQYPDGRVVNQQGQVVGTQAGDTFTPIENGPVVAQPAPEPAKQTQAVVVEKPTTDGDKIAAIFIGIFLAIFLAVIVGIIFI